MKSGLYIRLAAGNIRKNRKIYLPYILTCVCMIAIFYILAFLSKDPGVGEIRGGRTLGTILGFGYITIAIFSSLFLFYTNSFIVKRRRKELGLYNVLGMGKRHIAAVMFCENAMVGMLGLILGLGSGILLSKLSQMCLFKLMGSVAPFEFYVNIPVGVITVVIYSAVFFLIYLSSLRKLGTASPIELLRESSVGEKEPKGNFLISFLGLILIGIGYYLALTIKEPIEAMAWFFVAVILVIIGTYCCFISGSVTFLRLLKKNKKYYYSPKHFTSVSGMTYRMKRNGAGLASICILSTMVLVTLSSVTCLYVGKTESLRSIYPRQIILGLDHSDDMTADLIKTVIDDTMNDFQVKMEKYRSYRYFSGYVREEGGNIDFDRAGASSLIRIFAITYEDYTDGQGKAPLKDGEALVFYVNGDTPEKITFTNGKSYKVTGNPDAENFLLSGSYESSGIWVVLPGDEDIDGLVKMYADINFSGSPEMSFPNFYFGFDIDAPQDTRLNIYDKLSERLSENMSKSESVTYYSYSMSGSDINEADFFGTYSGLFFIGIFLGAAFILATILIMYYKQVTEGYEDQSRFDIMQKVGMTKSEIRSTVNSQVITVFFLPLIASGVHMAFAFSMINRVLILFNLDNIKLFLFTSGAAFLIFAVFYVIVYLVTSRAYFGIVSSVPDRRIA